MTVLPLEGIRVLNLGAVAAAPATCVILQDFGAEVIRAESTAKMDNMRRQMPLVNGLPPEDAINVSGSFLDFNRGAKSFLANLKSPKAIELIKELVKKCDVVVENFSVGTVKDLGLDYETLSKINPKIIMLSLSAVGQYGPYDNLMTYGPTVACLCGEQSMLGYPDGEPVQDYGTADFSAAQMATYCIMVALRHREKTGEGQYIDMGQVEPTIYTLGEPLMDLVMNDRVTHMQGNWRVGFVPNNNYRCKPDPDHRLPDQQWVSISVETEEEWKSMCKVMGDPAWVKDAQFSTKENRWKNQGELDNLISEWTINLPKYEVMEKLQKVGVAAMVVADEPLILTDPQWKAIGGMRPMDFPEVKGVLMAAPPIVLSDSPAPWVRGPHLGEHTDYVYGTIMGLSKAEIEALKKEEVLK